MYASFALILLLGIFITVFSAFSGYQAYTECVENIEKSCRSRDGVSVIPVTADELAGVIENEKKSYSTTVLKNPALLAALFVIAVTVLLIFSCLYALRIKRETSLLTDFFRKATGEMARQMAEDKMCAEEEIARLQRQIIAVSEEERKSIGRDLHDNLGSHLSGIELLCMALQKKLFGENRKRAEELEVIRDLIREAVGITRRLAQGFYPVHVVEHGLASAVKELQLEIENLFDVECVADCDVIEENIAGSAAIHIYSICREAVFNAARHGHPAKITIMLRARGETLRLEVKDDGHGFSTERIKAGIGLHTMKYRAEAIGAILHVQSDEACGTRVIIDGDNQLQ
ncbi:MAG: hypothetical protein CSB28_01415 [Desulfobacterales bacterium]|nr:MAG: hypothetical protein CSB28_01415 [Desulfobacterales bacterium]